jgi:spermidine synthase
LLTETIVIDTCSSPRGQLQLQRRGENYEIISNGTFLMATYNGESERSLVKMSLDASPNPRRVLIGGLGVGFSLAEALRHPQVEQVVVVEIEEKIIEWNTTHLAPFSQHALSNPRTQVVHADLLEYIRSTEDTFDCICLDIDNGPDWTVTEDNKSLYEENGLAALSRLLRPEGVITFWSASRSPAFAERMAQCFADIKEHLFEVERGEPDVVYIGRKK